MPSRVLSIFFLALTVLHVMIPAGPARGQGPSPDKAPSRTDAVDFDTLHETIRSTILAERETVAQFERQLERLREADRDLANEINAYTLQLSGNVNLIASPDGRAEELDRAFASHQATLGRLDGRLEELLERREAVRRSLARAEDQFALNQRQLLEIHTEGSDTARTQSLVEEYQRLIRLLSAKISHLEAMAVIHDRQIEQLGDVRKDFAEFSETLEEVLRTRRSEALFQRRGVPFLLLRWQGVAKEIETLASRIRGLPTASFWAAECQAVGEPNFALFFSALLLFALLEAFLLRIRRYCRRTAEEKDLARRYPWRHFSLMLFQRSLPLLGGVLFAILYARTRGFTDTLPAVQAVVRCLIIWLFTRWWLDLLSLGNELSAEKIPPILVFRLRVGIFVVRYHALVYVALSWLLGTASILLLILRALFYISVILWAVWFWQPFKRIDADGREIAGRFYGLWRRLGRGGAALPASRRTAAAKMILVVLGNGIIGGGIILEFIGYGPLALYWFVSWGWTSVVLLWAALLFLVIREWRNRFRRTAESRPEEVKKPADPLRWLLIQLSWILWLGALVIFLIMAWGGREGLILDLARMLHRPFPVGGMNLNLMAFFYALVALLVTHAATRVWKNTLAQRIFEDSGFEAGLKNSIIVIVIYLFWGVGIILGLNIIGVSATSITVAFGALGIGLGFGLQNIFSNFVSGIILLFERPIQVGDAVEVNGVWGEVRKINVRSTVVQTYDNASLIIPNADFISSQVTNWSFKDPRVRRIIRVGVAYGSDVEKVREILLEVAGASDRVLKYPRPYVLFTDFGESSLDFQLRFWSDVDSFIHVETELRFAIDRRFREEGVEIPFPQRDVHLKPAGGRGRRAAGEGAEEGPGSPPPGGTAATVD